MRLFTVVAAVLVLAAGLSASVAQAQERYWIIDYRLAAPLSNTSDLTGDFSWRGMGIEWHWMLQRHFSAGIGGGFNSFWEKTYETSQIGGADVTGTQLRYTNAVPIVGMFRYYVIPGDLGELRAHAGFDFGPYYVERRATIGFLSLDDDNWHFGIAPEFGVHVPFGDFYTRGVFNVRYNYAFESGDAPSQSWLDLEVGIAIDTP